mmetsp:Transcript_130089/g.277915  ORF Transcript_130089/g.277915 Transcript_130089/m.277915 type:complete len:386 (+) Transcript_130089:144-1301(+)
MTSLEEEAQEDEKESQRIPLLSPRNVHGGSSGLSSARLASYYLEELRRYDWVVEADTFMEYPGALSWARCTKALLVLMVCIFVFVVIVYYLMGVVEIKREYYRYSQIIAPTLVICPDMAQIPHHLSDFNVTNVTAGTYPSQQGISRKVDYAVQDCLPAVHCTCVDFRKHRFKKHHDGTDLLRIHLTGASESGAFLFGFMEPGDKVMREVPQTFNYGRFQTRALGYVSMHLEEENEQKLWNSLSSKSVMAWDLKLYDWEIAGNAVPTSDNHTEVLFGLKSFQVSRDLTFSSLLSPFAIISLAAFTVSMVNNLNFFGLVFPVQEHPIFTQREPASWLRAACCCCPCVRHRKELRRARTRLEELIHEHEEQLLEDLKIRRHSQREIDV